jgi:hypothetical protein
MLATEDDQIVAITEPGMREMLKQDETVNVGNGTLRMPERGSSASVSLLQMPSRERSAPITELKMPGSESLSELSILNSPTRGGESSVSTRNLSSTPVDSLFSGLLSISSHARSSTAPPKLRSEVHLLHLERTSQSTLKCRVVQTHSIPAVGIDKIEFNV